MTSRSDGGPAFPHAVEKFDNRNGAGWDEKHGGMTSREYLAAHAPQQVTDMCSEAAAEIVGRPMPEWKPYMESKKELASKYQLDLAKFRIELDVGLRLIWADAMIAARSKG